MVLLQSRTHYYHQGRDGKCDTGHTTAFFAIVPQITASSQAGHVADPVVMASKSSSRDRGRRRGVCTAPAGALARRAAPGAPRCSRRPAPRRANSTPAAEASAGRARGTPRLCGDVDGLHGRSMERRKGAPDISPRRDLPTRSSPSSLSNSRRPPRRGRFCTSNLCGPPVAPPRFQAADAGTPPRYRSRAGHYAELAAGLGRYVIQDLVREPAPSPSADPLLGIHHEVDGFLALSFHPPSPRGPRKSSSRDRGCPRTLGGSARGRCGRQPRKRVAR